MLVPDERVLMGAGREHGVWQYDGHYFTPTLRPSNTNVSTHNANPSPTKFTRDAGRPIAAATKHTNAAM
jgi:hypothetical protein